MTPEELDDRYDGDVARFAETVELSAEEWTDGRVRADRFRGGVGAAVRHDSRLLLIRQRDWWMLPGGMLEPGETHAESAVREVHEETGIPVEIDGLGAVVDGTFTNAETGETFSFAFAAFLARPAHTRIAADPGLPGEDIEDVAWHASLPADTFQREVVATLVDG